jgi:preprotein translocase subunit SecE
MFKKIFAFLKSVKQEMSYVSYPSKADLKEGTTVVIFMSALVALFLTLVDGIFGYIIRTVLMGM